MYQVNILFRHVMVEEDPDGHHGRGPGGHGRVHQHHAIVLDVLWKSEVIQLGLSRLWTRLKIKMA